MHGIYKTFHKFYNKELEQLINFLENMIKETPELKEDAKKDFEPMAKGKIVSEKITGEKAEVVWSYTDHKKPQKTTYKLQKLKGTWNLVD